MPLTGTLTDGNQTGAADMTPDKPLDDVTGGQL